MSDQPMPLLKVRDVIEVAPGRLVRLRLGPARTTLVHDWRGRVAVRNVATNRLSHIPEWRLRRCKQRQQEEIVQDESGYWLPMECLKVLVN